MSPNSTSILQENPLAIPLSLTMVENPKKGKSFFISTLLFLHTSNHNHSFSTFSQTTPLIFISSLPSTSLTFGRNTPTKGGNLLLFSFIIHLIILTLQHIFFLSLVDGFNVPMDFSPLGGNCNGIRCNAPINAQCPNQLRAPGGCNNPCTVFKTDQYCCNSGRCGPTNFSRYFKTRCPTSYSYPKDDPTSTFTCPAGANYRVVFCP